MTDKDYNNILEFCYMGGGWIPANQNANELSEQLVKGEITQFKEVTQRDISFHRCYFALLAEIWGYMPAKFKKKIPKEKFYLWLKHLKGEYKVIFEFKDGTKMVEYDSISFGKLSQIKFKEYVKEQMPFIYTNVIGAFFEGEIYNSIIGNIESDFERFFDKLN